jgi:hypothetical protein
VASRSAPTTPGSAMHLSDPRARPCEWHLRPFDSSVTGSLAAWFDTEMPAPAAIKPVRGMRISTQQVLAAAMRMHRDNMFEAAEDGYREVMRKDRRNANAMHFLGVLLWQRNRARRRVT